MMSYKSHRKSSGRAFDHLYDPITKASTKTIAQMNLKALTKSAPLHIIPCYHSMFSDLVTKRRNFYFAQRNSLPIDTNSCAVELCNRKLSKNALVFNPSTELSQNFHLHVEGPKSELKRSIDCQTKFRVSSAQTEPWLPDVKNPFDEGARELMLVKCLTEPNILDVEAIERARIRNKIESSLADKDFQSQVATLEALEWKEIIAREKILNEQQSDRMEQVLEIMKDRDNQNHKFHEAILKNMQKRNVIEKNSMREKLHKTHEREMRRLSQKKDQKVGKSYAINDGKSIFDLTESDTILETVLSSSACLISSLKRAKLKKSKSRNLWTPKDVLHRGAKSEKQLKVLYESVKSDYDEHVSTLQCRKKLAKEFEIVENISEYKDEALLVKVQKTIKGQAVQRILYSGMVDSLKTIEHYRKKFHYDCVDGVFHQTFPQTKSKSENSSVQELEHDLQEETESLVKECVQEVIDVAEQTVNDEISKRILYEAELERQKRQQQALHEEKINKNRMEISEKIENLQENLTKQTLECILPSVVELIAEQNIRNFIETISEDVDDVACRSDHTDSDIVASVVEEIVMPEIDRRFEAGKTRCDQVIALIAANDAVEEILKKL